MLLKLHKTAVLTKWSTFVCAIILSVCTFLAQSENIMHYSMKNINSPCCEICRAQASIACVIYTGTWNAVSSFLWVCFKRVWILLLPECMSLLNQDKVHFLQCISALFFPFSFYSFFLSSCFVFSLDAYNTCTCRGSTSKKKPSPSHNALLPIRIFCRGGHVGH